MKSPCETCTRSEYGCTGCDPWRQYYGQKQSRINAYARQLYQPRVASSTKFCYAHPDEVRRYLRHSPCESCQANNICDTPCAAYLRWWDARMEYMRRKYVKTKSLWIV